MTRDLFLASSVVEAALVAAADAAYRLPSVEEGDRLVVLPFAVLDDQAVAWVVAVDRQASAAPVAPSVADQPLEAVLAAACLAKQLIAQVKYVRLVAVDAGPWRNGRSTQTTGGVSASRRCTASFVIAGGFKVRGTLPKISTMMSVVTIGGWLPKFDEDRVRGQEDRITTRADGVAAISGLPW